MFAIVADRLHKDSPTPVVPEQGSYDTIQKLISFIDNNYASDMKINEAAAITGFSKYHFLRLFTKYTGYTFHEYVMLKRIQASENLLSTNASITDVAYSTGFQSSSSFSRAFKKLTGKTPREYKKLIISENIEEHDT